MFLWREENWRTWRKTLGARTRTNNKLNPCMTAAPRIEPGSHWWEVSALTTAVPFLLPRSHSLCHMLIAILMSKFVFPDGQGFTRERKTRLLQLEEERKEPQSVPTSRQMTTAEFAVVCVVSFFPFLSL